MIENLPKLFMINFVLKFFKFLRFTLKRNLFSLKFVVDVSSFSQPFGRWTLNGKIAGTWQSENIQYIIDNITNSVKTLLIFKNLFVYHNIRATYPWGHTYWGPRCGLKVFTACCAKDNSSKLLLYRTFQLAFKLTKFAFRCFQPLITWRISGSVKSLSESSRSRSRTQTELSFPIEWVVSKVMGYLKIRKLSKNL